LLSLIGDFKFTPFDEGEAAKCTPLAVADEVIPALKESVDWFVKNYHNARIGNPKI
jgi:hypothetical protein